MPVIDKLKRMLGMSDDNDRTAAESKQSVDPSSAKDTADESTAAVDEEQPVDEE